MIFSVSSSTGITYPAGKDTETLGVIVPANASIKALVYWSAENCNNSGRALDNDALTLILNPLPTLLLWLSLYLKRSIMKLKDSLVHCLCMFLIPVTHDARPCYNDTSI